MSENQETEKKRASLLAPADQAHEEVLKRLPANQRNSILKQYDLPEINVSILTILRYATPFESLLQIIGLLMAFGAGISWTGKPRLIVIGAALPLMTILLGNLTNTFGGFASPGAPSLTPPPSNDAFRAQVSQYLITAVINRNR
jgi:hypothetical protein